MAVYMQKTDKRNTSGGLTPNKSIRRPAGGGKKPSMTKPTMRKTQGK